MVQSSKVSEVKDSKTAKNIKVVQGTEVENKPQTAKISESLLNTWAEGLDLVFKTQKNLEDRYLQILETQKESWENVNSSLSQMEEEQKKIYENIREASKSNLQSLFGQYGSNVMNPINAQFDMMDNFLQKATLNPYKEGIKLILQNQDQFKQSAENYFEQQQAFREEWKKQIKSTQKTSLEFYEKNLNIAFSFFK